MRNKIVHLAGRLAVTGSVVAPLLLGATPLRASPLDPAVVVGSFDDTLLAVMSQAKTLGYRGRYKLLEPTVSQTFDIRTMTRTAVGLSWAELSETQKDRLTEAFYHFITATFAKRFDDLAGEKFEAQGVRMIAGGIFVETHLVQPSGEQIRINFLTH